MSLARFGDFAAFAKFLSFSSIGCIVTYYLANPRHKRSVDWRNVVVTTGCDSGLGYSIAVHCHNNLNMSVVACVHHLDSKGAVKLKNQFAASDRFHLIELEITKNESIASVNKFLEDLLEKNENLSKFIKKQHENILTNLFAELTALVNNCGLMCFGETEWQTNEIIESQINVNLSGTIRMTRGLLPLIRNQKSRIINVTSHCGLRPLPGLSVYSATKAGLLAFTDALRLDMEKYEVEVVNFIPGSFVMSSNIASNQTKLADQMRSSFSMEQKSFYGDYFDRYNGYLKFVAGEKEPQMVDSRIIETFEEALLEVPPRTRYICEPLRYKVFNALFKITPQKITDLLIHKFVSMPKFDPKKSNLGVK